MNLCGERKFYSLIGADSTARPISIQVGENLQAPCVQPMEQPAQLRKICKKHWPQGVTFNKSYANVNFFTNN